MDAGEALAGLSVAVAMLIGVELVGRFDLWMRANGLGRFMIGSRTYAVAMTWFFRVVIAAFAVYCLVVLLTRL